MRTLKVLAQLYASCRSNTQTFKSSTTYCLNLKSHLTITPWKYLDTILLQRITLTLNKGEFVFIIKTLIIFLTIDVKYLHKCTSFKIRVGDNYCKFAHLFRSPSQRYDKFATFSKNFELTSDKIHKINSFMTSVLGDFNAQPNGLGKTRHHFP